MKALDALRDAGVFNTHGLAEVGDYFVTFTSYHGQGRFPVFYGWHLHRKGFVFKNQHWADRCAYALHSGDDLKDRDLALAEAGAKISVREWARDPFGAWWPVGVLRDRLGAVGVPFRGKIVTV